MNIFYYFKFIFLHHYGEYIQDIPASFLFIITIRSNILGKISRDLRESRYKLKYVVITCAVIDCFVLVPFLRRCCEWQPCVVTAKLKLNLEHS